MSVKNLMKRGILFILHGLSYKEVTANIFYLSPAARLKGKRIIVTGGGKGLGAAMAACSKMCNASSLTGSSVNLLTVTRVRILVIVSFCIISIPLLINSLIYPNG